MVLETEKNARMDVDERGYRKRVGTLQYPIEWLVAQGS
jgi:hypothetical protein